MNFRDLQSGLRYWLTIETLSERLSAGEDPAPDAANSAMFSKVKKQKRVGSGPPTLESRFLAVNQDKLRRVRDNLTIRQRDLVDMLPLLFHSNRRLLPGYIARTTPAGICDYVPTRQARAAAKRLVPSFRYEARTLQRFVIKGLYLMGSPGTVGYSKSSDLDIWLVHEPELDEAQVVALHKKAQKIEAYAASISLEMHFFVFDAERFRSGETLSLSDESSGSSQYHLLLDEFYRSGLLLAGLKPLWWCVPPGDERRYEEFIREAFKTPQEAERNYVDFGAVANIPANEFFGAAVWQLYKSINSPYKSVLKLLLMETYAADYPSGQLLSHRYKEMIATGHASLNDLDPYILMYRKVEEYLTAKNDSTRLDLMRRSFYLKTNVRLSDASETRETDWRHESLHELTRSWNWSAEDIQHLNNRGQWKIPSAAEERRDLIKALRQSYAALSKFARGYDQDQKITKTDLNILGRKLYAAFDRKPSKIELITRGICPDPWESDLSLHRIIESDSPPLWVLYSGLVTPERTDENEPLMQVTAPAEILAWCHFNRLLSTNTNWHIYDPKNRLTVSGLRKALEAIDNCYPGGAMKTVATSALEAAPRPLKALLMLNIGIDPLAGKVQDGGVLTSDRTDAFQFGGQRINLIQAVDLLMMTSWEEIFVYHFEGTNGLIDSIMEYLQWGTPLGSSTLPAVEVCCVSNDHAHSISQRVEHYANGLIKKMCTVADNEDHQLITQFENRYCRTYIENTKPHYETYKNFSTMLNSLGRPRAVFGDVEFDEGCHGVSLLKCIFARNSPGVIQLFVLEHDGQVDIYVLDEYGALFSHHQECYRIEMIFDHYYQFLQNLLKYHPQTINMTDRLVDDEPIELFRLRLRALDSYTVSSIPVGMRLGADYLPIRVFVDVDDNGNQQFTMFCEDVEFSSTEHGGRLFIVIAEFIFARRGYLETYPIYITDLELSNRFRAHRSIDNQQTSHLLNFKKRIEDQLTRALRDDISTTPQKVTAM